VTQNVPLQPYNSFGIVAKAYSLVRIRSEEEALASQQDLKNCAEGHCVVGGGSNIVLTGDVKARVLKVEIPGKRLASETAKAWIVEAGAGENWHDFVAWTLAQG
jgi:UDP-N-acetylmuramate dehydrogenase